MKKYKMIFFDWDGTAVLSRNASADDVAAAMKKLLGQGVKLAIISGTTIENIAQGKLHEYFTIEERQHLFYGLGRGAYNYLFNQMGQPELFLDMTPSKETLLKIHHICYLIHEELLKNYNFNTDIVFSRPNYCKIDLMVDNNRGDQLFFQHDELKLLLHSLERHGITGGLPALLQLAARIAGEQGLELSATTDAKYLEVGLTSKSDNVDAIMDYVTGHFDIQSEDCSFWGDEYVGMAENLFGSDSFMITDKTRNGDFFDVSEAAGKRPPEVQLLHGGVEQFLQFLNKQAENSF